MERVITLDQERVRSRMVLVGEVTLLGPTEIHIEETFVALVWWIAYANGHTLVRSIRVRSEQSFYKWTLNETLTRQLVDAGYWRGGPDDAVGNRDYEKWMKIHHARMPIPPRGVK